MVEIMVIKNRTITSSTIFTNGAGEENRTPVSSLEGYYSTIKLHLQVIKIITQFSKNTIKSLNNHKIMVRFICIYVSILKETNNG